MNVQEAVIILNPKASQGGHPTTHKMLDEVEQFLLYCKNTRHLKAKTLRGYRSDLSRTRLYLEAWHNSPYNISHATSVDIDFYFDALAVQGLKPASIARIYYCLSAFAKFCKKRFETKNFMDDVDPPPKYSRKERVFLTKEEAFTFIEAIEHPVIALLAKTIYYTGLRNGEICSLRIQDVNFETKKLSVYYEDEHDRDVPLSEEILPLLQKYRFESRDFAKPDESFFATNSGGISASYVTEIFHQTRCFLGWDKVITPHVFRHTFATRLVKENVHIVIIQRLLGHKDLKATMVYTHAYDTDTKEAVDLL